jgi:hypothetical protein
VKFVSFGHEYHYMLPVKPVTIMRSSLVIAFFSYLNRCCSSWPRLAQKSAWCVSCLRNTNQFKDFFSPVRKSSMNLQHEHKDACEENCTALEVRDYWPNKADGDAQ